MESKDKLMFGLAFFALCFSMFSLGLSSFAMAGIKISPLALYAVGLVSLFSMIIYFVLGFAFILGKKLF